MYSIRECRQITNLLTFIYFKLSGGTNNLKQMKMSTDNIMLFILNASRHRVNSDIGIKSYYNSNSGTNVGGKVSEKKSISDGRDSD